MTLINSSVRHKVFGEGKIYELDETTVSIQFGLDVKKFIFPDAFREHLIITEKESKQYVDGILNEIEQEAQLRRETAILNDERRRKLEKLPNHSNAQAAFKFFENEKQSFLTQWSVSAGTCLSGSNRGKPRSPARIYPNSACLLTSCGDNDSEDDRFIWGVYMVKDDFVGSDCNDGMIPAHEKYRIILDESESKTLLFWHCAGCGAGSQIARWGSTEMKYISNKLLASVLHKILFIKRGTEQEQLCKDFIDYYCKLNKIDTKQIAIKK